MGQVCAKNDAGRVATDAPKPKLQKNNQDLVSQQQAPPAPSGETKFVTSEINFNVDKGVDKKADELAAETANNWCATNRDWTYTGTWKNERKGDGEISHFQVRMKVEATVVETQGAAAQQNPQGITAVDKKSEPKNAGDLNMSKKTDAKQSFVEQVSEGLLKKVPADRIESDGQGLPAEAPAKTVEVESKGAVDPHPEASDDSDKNAAAEDKAEALPAPAEPSAPAQTTEVEQSEDKEYKDSEEEKKEEPEAAEDTTKPADEEAKEEAKDKIEAAPESDAPVEALAPVPVSDRFAAAQNDEAACDYITADASLPAEATDKPADEKDSEADVATGLGAVADDDE